MARKKSGSDCICKQKLNVLMIMCDECNKWFHAKCINKVKHEIDLTDQFYCTICENSCGKSTLKDRKFCLADSKQGPVLFKRGHEVTLQNFIETGFNSPILVNKIDDLKIEVPDKDLFNFESVISLSEDIDLSVINVKQQTNVDKKLYDFVKQFSVPPKDRKEILNSLSFEISEHKLGEQIKAPAIVYELSWLHKYWCNVKNKKAPPISKFCLLSMQNSFTDFHLDFGGTSVWYYVHKGKKIFYLAKPTEHNLKEYGIWYKTAFAKQTFLGENLDKCYKLILTAGQTLFIPSGYLHAVITPCDSIVFGGNFFNSLHIEMQLKIVDMEIKLDFDPFYTVAHIELVHWCAVDNVIDFLKTTSSIDFILSVKTLISKLEVWAKNCQKYLTFKTKIKLCELKRELSESENRVVYQIQHNNNFKCKICNKEFIYKSNLSAHEKSHSDVRPFECEVNSCGAKFKRKGHLLGHMNIHSDDKPFKCDECENTFKNISNLNQHFATIHSSKKFKCSLCDYNKNTKNKITEHMKEKHTQEGLYKCDYETCEQTFVNKSKMESHFYTHSKTKKFNCDQNGCKMKFVRKWQLQIHQRNIHKNSS